MLKHHMHLYPLSLSNCSNSYQQLMEGQGFAGWLLVPNNGRITLHSVTVVLAGTRLAVSLSTSGGVHHYHLAHTTSGWEVKGDPTSGRRTTGDVPLPVSAQVVALLFTCTVLLPFPIQTQASCSLA